MAREHFSIGEIARETGCKVQTIRYYEQIGLMPAPARTAGNQRRYGPQHAARLAFIRHGRELGFPLEAVRAFLSLSDNPEQPCETADRIAQAQLREVESRIVRLEALKEELERMVEQCKGGKIADCRVIEVLSDHAHCLHESHHAQDVPGAEVARASRALSGAAGKLAEVRGERLRAQLQAFDHGEIRE